MAAKGRPSTSGIKGVYWHKKKEKWHARLYINKKHTHLGYYSTKEEAAQAIEKVTINRDGIMITPGQSWKTRDGADRLRVIGVHSRGYLVVEMRGGRIRTFYPDSHAFYKLIL